MHNVEQPNCPHSVESVYRVDNGIDVDYLDDLEHGLELGEVSTDQGPLPTVPASATIIGSNTNDADSMKPSPPTVDPTDPPMVTLVDSSVNTIGSTMEPAESDLGRAQRP
ncbi:unnamed protein product [Amaranthus hypochondriacus]